MTTQLPSKERLRDILEYGSSRIISPITDAEIEAMARALLAAYEQEPVAYMHHSGQVITREECCDDEVFAICCKVETPLYAHPAPSIPANLHPDTQKLVADFSTALAEKLYKAQLKYGYSDNWTRDGWAEECLQHFHHHISKGDPRDVAAYCAFMWFHGWSTALPAPSIPAVPDEASIFEAAIDICRKSDSIDEHAWNHGVLAVMSAFRTCRAAAVGEGIKQPSSNDGWIPVSERMPVNVNTVVTSNGADIGHGWWDGERWFEDDPVPEGITHWQPLPAAPKE